jgi:hypothetical protein
MSVYFFHFSKSYQQNSQREMFPQQNKILKANRWREIANGFGAKKNATHASGPAWRRGSRGNAFLPVCYSWMQFEVVKLAADCIRGQQPRCPVYLQCCLHCIAIARACYSV